MRNMTSFDSIRHGDRIKFHYSSGSVGHGRAVMRSPAGGWVVNTGGRYGTPSLVTEKNFISATSGGKMKGMGWHGQSLRHRWAAMKGGKMQWHGKEVVAMGGTSRPIHPAFAFKTRKSRFVKLKDGTVIRFEKSVFNPKGMVMKK